MDKLDWCKNQNSGIELIEKNPNLSKEYLLKAENALRAMNTLEGNDEWQISAAYYAMYFSLYSVLMKIGIRCQIHSCTIEVMKILKDFESDDVLLLQKSLGARIDSQYYTDREIGNRERLAMVEEAPRFHLKCKEIAIRLTAKEIAEIRAFING